MSDSKGIEIAPGLGGWAFVAVPDLDVHVYIRFALPRRVTTKSQSPVMGPVAGPMLKAEELYLDGRGKTLSAQFLRELPLAAIEILANSSEIRHSLVEGLSGDSAFTPARTALSAFHLKEAKDTKQRSFRPKTIGFVRNRPQLKRPDTSRISDQFLSHVAQVYLEALATGQRPLVAIQSEAKVPRGTAAKWVGMAREEGYLAFDPEVKKRTSNRGVQQR